MHKEWMGYRQVSIAIIGLLTLVLTLILGCSTVTQPPTAVAGDVRQDEPPRTFASVWVISTEDSEHPLYVVHCYATGFVPLLGTAQYNTLEELCWAVRRGDYGRERYLRNGFDGQVYDTFYKVRKLNSWEMGQLIAKSSAKFIQ